MRRRNDMPCYIILLAILSFATLPAWAQNGKLKTRIEHNGSNHTTIVIHDTRPQAYARQRDAAERAESAREAHKQRQHEIELAKIEANSRVQVARAQNMVAQQPQAAPVVSYREEKKPSYRNGGYYTGFSDFFLGGYGGYGYGGGYAGYPYRGGGNYAPRSCAAPIRRCAPTYRRCR